MKPAIHGLWPALLLPLLPDGELDTALAIAHAQRMLKAGCDGVTLFGTTGEGPAFTVAERQSLLESMLGSGIRPDQVVVTTTASALGDAITLGRVLETLRITHTSLSTLLGRRPRIAVAGVNPHAGEGGLFGREEIDVLKPALSQARHEGLDVHGPFAPDTVFMRARQKPSIQREFDVVVAMHHDQGLIPVKYMGVEQGVNVTLGLPLIRTSPDHGTAMDVAGQGVANASSMVQAIRMARQLVAGKAYEEA